MNTDLLIFLVGLAGIILFIALGELFYVRRQPKPKKRNPFPNGLKGFFDADCNDR